MGSGLDPIMDKFSIKNSCEFTKRTHLQEDLIILFSNFLELL